MNTVQRELNANSQNTPLYRVAVEGLDGLTQLDAVSDHPAWNAVVFPEAGEAAVFRSGGAGGDGLRHREPEGGQGRARRRMRRYAAANHLSRLVTLTFEEAERDLGRGRRRLKRALRACRGRVGAPFPYISVIEEHPRGHGIHLHVLVPASVDVLLRREWSFGHVNIRRLAQSKDIRRAAAYLTKAFNAGSHGKHRYEVAQGFTPVGVRLAGPTRWNVWDQLQHFVGSASAEVTSFVDRGWPLWLVLWDTLCRPGHHASYFPRRSHTS